MKGLLTAINILNAIVVISFFVYYPIVYQNLTYTNGFLPFTSIPYYANNTWMGVYNVYWWVFWTDVLRILVPVYILTSFALCIIYRGGYALISEIILVILFIVELAKLIWRAVDWATCASVDFCRNFDSTIATPSSDISANYVFQIAFWYNLVFLIVILVYGYMAAIMEREYNRYYRNLTVEACALRGPKESYRD